MKTLPLTVELVPRNLWFLNLRRLAPAAWEIIRKRVYTRAGNKCEIPGCGATGRQEAHETWAYDDATGIVRLEKIRSLCPRCHQVKHFGLAQVKGNGDQAMRQLREINGLSVEDATVYVEAMFEQWSQRSSREWSMDTDFTPVLGSLLSPAELADAVTACERNLQAPER